MSDDKHKKKKLSFNKKIVLCLLCTYLLFVISCVVYQFMAREGMSEILIGSVSGFCTGEAGFLSFLKVKERQMKKGVEEECQTG